MRTRKEIEKEIAKLQEELKQVEESEYTMPGPGFYLVERECLFGSGPVILVLSQNLTDAPPVYGFNRSNECPLDVGWDREDDVKRLIRAKNLKVIKRLDISDIIRYVQEEKTEDN